MAKRRSVLIKKYGNRRPHDPDRRSSLPPAPLAVRHVTDGLEAAGWILVNARAGLQPEGCESFRRAPVDASTLAIDHGLGSRAAPIVNTSILGGFARATGLVGIDSIVEAIRDEVPLSPDENAAAARAAYDATVLPN